MENELNKRNTLLLGALFGAVTGLMAAFLLVRKADRNESSVAVTSGEGFRLGILIIGLLRQIAQLSE